MNAKVAEPRRARENKTLRALASVKEFSELVADDPVADSTNALAKRAGKIVKNCGLPFNESVALLETLFAVVDVATSTKESVVASAVKAQRVVGTNARSRRRDCMRVCRLRRVVFPLGRNCYFRLGVLRRP